MTLKSLMMNDMSNTFLNTDEFGESITYVTKAGVEKSISAVVSRGRLDPDEETAGRSLSDEIEIRIANDSTAGVTSVDAGFDKVKVPEYLGEAADTWRIVEILSHDASMWHLKCVK